MTKSIESDREFFEPVYNVCSVDLGYANDFTAVTVGTMYKRIVVPVFGEPRIEGREMIIRYQNRWKMIPYPQTIERIKRIISKIPVMKRQLQLYTLIDVGGCGLPVFHELRQHFYQSSTYVIGIQLTGGESGHQENGVYYVPKKDIVGSLIYMAETGILKLAGDLKTRDALTDEWQNFTRKRRESGSEAFEAGTGHDDLICSLGFLANYCMTQREVSAVSLKALHGDFDPRDHDLIPGEALVRFELKDLRI